jgi:outer membrane protein OmpA-like peptidoglycan-associated protein
MRLSRPAIAGLLLLASAAPLAAQKPGAVELGVFGRYNWLDNALHFDDRGGVGGRLGIFVLRNLEIEGDGSYNPTYTQAGDFVRYVPWHARLLYNARFGTYYTFIIGAGYTDNWFRENYRETSPGAGGLLGFRLGTGDVLSIRADVTGDYITNPESRKSTGPSTGTQGVTGIEHADKNWHYGAQLGLSLVFGDKRDRDTDKDGVLDKADQCPNTPAGDRVDANGCSLDSDGDGVKDAIDKCPSSPPGDKVDAEGCSLDTDKDGVRDAIDRCPDTPAGDQVDANGCTLPKDADADGVTDDKDQCPATPAGEKVDVNGCSLDTDKDGVRDAIDQCPDTPVGDHVDANGCSLPKDSDGDGVMDNVDRCPNTPPGVTVDANGCRVVTLSGGSSFATGKSALTPAGKKQLDDIAAILVANPSIRVGIEGYTDNTGTRATNDKLSQARADAVKTYMVSKGVAADRMVAQGHGPDDPIAPNTTAVGRAQNRRVVLHQIQ